MNEYVSTYYLLLDHALVIHAREQHQVIVASMTPHLEKKDRDKIINSYLEIIEENTNKSSAIINDRERFKKILKKQYGR